MALKPRKNSGIPEGTIAHTRLKAVRNGKLDIGEGSHTPAGAMSTFQKKLPCCVSGFGAGQRNPTSEGEQIFGGSQRFFRRQPSEVSKNQRMMFLALKTEDGRITGKIAFYCTNAGISRQGF